MTPSAVDPVGSAAELADSAAEPADVLTVRGLTVSVRDLTLVEDVDLTVGPGERVGLIGESGSGKSLTALSVLGLLPEDVHASGSVRLAGVDHDLIGADERRMSRVRGSNLAMVFQEPMTALNPTMRVGDQIAEAMLIHGTVANRRAARTAAEDLLQRVELSGTARAYPHQLSGGQRQRVVVAIALANDPALLICDEPTTALDVTVQAMILDLILQGVAARESALLFITHDLAVVATVCDRVLVMYGGRVVESGPVHEIFTTPRHRYTQGLLAASDLASATRRLPTIPGTVPTAGHPPPGCVFTPRCPHATDICHTPPPWTGTQPTGYACHHPAPSTTPPTPPTPPPATTAATPPAATTAASAPREPGATTAPVSDPVLASDSASDRTPTPTATTAPGATTGPHAPVSDPVLASDSASDRTPTPTATSATTAPRAPGAASAPVSDPAPASDSASDRTPTPNATTAPRAPGATTAPAPGATTLPPAPSATTAPVPASEAPSASASAAPPNVTQPELPAATKPTSTAEGDSGEGSDE